MSPRDLLPRGGAVEEVAALVETLLDAGHRLEELTAGEVDAVAGRDGQVFLLRQAQDQLRAVESTKQAAILNALPANIALLNTQGLIVSVNEAWQQFAHANAAQASGHGVGINYLAICDIARGNDSTEAHQAAAGIRSVLSGEVKRFSLEYPCHSPDEQRWFLMTVTPLSDDYPNGAVVMHLNITARMQAEAAHARLATILESTTDLVSISDPAGRLTYLNRAARHALGVGTHEEIAPTKIADFIPDPANNLILTEGIPTAIRAGAWSGESVLLTRHGQKIPVSQVIIAHKTTDGKLAYLSTIMRDITKTKQIEETLLQQQTELRLLFDLMPAMIWFKDTQNGILRVNQRVAIAAGKPVEEIEGKSCLEIYPQEASKYYADDLEVIHSGVPRLGIIETLLGPGGEESWVQTDKVPYRDKDGKIVGIVVMAQDITERKRTEDAFKASELKYHSLFENMLEGYAYCRTIFVQDRLRDFVYLEVNSAFEKLTGLKDVVGKKISDIIPGVYETSPELFEIYGRVAKTGKQEKYETYFQPLGIWISITVYSHEREHFVAVFDNITMRKLADEALRTSMEEFRTLAEAMPQIVWVTNAEGQNIYFNQQWVDYTGLTLAESLGDGWNKPFHPDDKQHSWEAWGKAAAEHSIYSLESRLRRADGTYRWWLVRGVPLLGADGNISKWFGTCTDIHDLKMAGLEIARTNKELRESEQRFSDLLGNVELVSMMLDREARITYCNDYLLRLTGWQREEVIGKIWWDIFMPPELHDLKGDLFSALLDNQPDALHHENDIVTRSGERRLIRWNNSVLRSADGDVIGAASIGEDITERKAAESQVAYLNRVYAMLSGIHTLIVRARDREELFSQACKVAVEIGGFRMAMIVIADRSTMTMVPMASAGKDEELIDDIKNILSSGELASTTLIARAIREKNFIVSNDSQNDPRVVFGNKYIEAGVYSMIILPLIVSGEAVGALALYASERNFFRGEELKLLTGLAGDISYALDYLKAEAALQSLNEQLENKVATRTADLEKARHEADQANQAKSRFLTTMSHEIRTPMNGVIGMIDVLHETSLKGYQVEMVDLIRESAYSLLDIIEDILDLSKIESGKLEIERAPMSVVNVVEKACGLLDQLAARKGVDLTLFIDPAIPEEVLSDALRLRQVLVNIASNAIKFSSGRQWPGQVAVRALLVKQGSNQVTVDLQVTDNGIGMDEETQLRLFKAFSQADASTTRRFGGTGLGLVISNRLVELMGGKIAVHSAPGKGATFTVRLPLAPLPAKPPSGGKIFDLTGLSCLVLGGQGLADDLVLYLNYSGAIVERASDLTTARKLIGTVSPGRWVIIVDAGHDTSPVEELRAACRARANPDPHFMVIENKCLQPCMEPPFVVISRGRRRQGRVQTMDLITLDGNVMRRQSFLRAVANASGRTREDEEDIPVPGKAKAISPPSREAALRQGRLILVAEDNETNRKVILYQLGLLGYAADVTSDGREALECWESGDYALLLTDLHMPEMDGYQLTAAIRTREAGKQHIPILALTANALKAEVEHCHAVGMDDYLTKPAQLAELKDMLEKWLPAAAAARPDSPATQAPVDVRVLKALVGDDPTVIQDFLHNFRASAAMAAAELRMACENGQAAQAGALAHKLMSSARSVGALVLGALCVEIEHAGNTGQGNALTALLSRFEAEMAVVDEYIGSL